MENNLLPYDAEVSFLSLLIKTPVLFHDIKNIKYWMFSAVPHQILFQTIIDINSKNLVADVNLLHEALKAENNLDKIGSIKYLDYLSSLDLSIENFPEYEKLIINSYKTRAISAISVKVSSEIKTKDPTELIEETKEALDKLSLYGGGENTRPLDQVLDDTLVSLEKKAENPGIVGIGLGIEQLDLITGGACGGEVWYIGGRPGMGKTAMMCNWILHAGKLNYPILIIEREMRDTSLAERLLALETGISVNDLRNGRLDKSQLITLRQASDKIRSYPIYIDTDMSEGFEYSIATSKRYIHNKGVKLIYIDYIQLETEREENQTQELGALSRKLKRISVGEDVTFIAFSQLNRLVELRDNKRPRLSDLRQCGNLEEDADFVVGLYRPSYYEDKMKNSKILEHIILKARNGPTGTVTLDFIPETNKITEHKR